MRKHLISLSILVIALQACSGNPAGFQGDAPSAPGTVSSSDAGRQQNNRDAEDADATGVSGESNPEFGSTDRIEGSTLESESTEMEAADINEGLDAVVSIPKDAIANPGSTGSVASTGTMNTSNQPLTLTITVPSTSIRSGSTAMQATAKLSGQSTAASVNWTVKASGSQSAGSVSASGLYIPPAAGVGGYDVVLSAALVDDPTITASVTLKIIAPEQIFVSCQQGSSVFPIKADVYQLPTNTTKLPDFGAIGAKLTTVCMDQYDVAARDWSTGFPGVSGLFEWFALRTTARVVIPVDGSYTFKLNSDDGAKLYIDNQLVIDNDGQHAPTAKTAIATLTAGEHDLRIDYFQGPRYQIALELFWKVPGSASYVYVPKTSFK